MAEAPDPRRNRFDGWPMIVFFTALGLYFAYRFLREHGLSAVLSL